MHLIIIIASVLVVVIAGPHLWVRHVKKKYSADIVDMPGTGGELASHLVQRFGLDDVRVVMAQSGGDHYSTEEKTIRLSPETFRGKSLTAVAVAAHEVGHAIQYARGENITKLRAKYSPAAQSAEKLALTIFMFSPVILAVLHVPQLVLLTIATGLIALLASVAAQMVVLPLEWDASFNKALPILVDGEYITPRQEAAVRRILRAESFTYVANTLADMFRLWRWIAILRGATR
ncbi:zinc metallopeptidase [Hahella sp. HN01]|uniref:zinc metallopeptidase n=1 Tax=unclassified Hahella TaxID=2624107 RepID=UPI001C1F000C|nr:zinc metallopeptidase [Hahella sp. HN01]MBU6954077.1 zinc metallopeptidase [Hahella sp. HN01]